MNHARDLPRQMGERRTGPGGETRKPRVAFLGTGWIGYNRMEAVARSGGAEIVAVADTDPRSSARAAELANGCDACGSLEELLAHEPDGIVIATPNACHAEQTVTALEAGASVFCQKPLGIHVDEVRAAVAAAQRTDRLLHVDYSYRHTAGLKAIRQLIGQGALGKVFAAELTFHNAYGPDKDWYYDSALSGGGCLTDLGVHLVDMALWCLDFPAIKEISGRLFRDGKALPPASREGEDYALVDITLENGGDIRLGCSWRAHAGKDAQIAAQFWGPESAARWENIDGSFYNFEARKFTGTGSELLTSPGEPWGEGAILDWVKRVSEGGRYDPVIEETVEIARVLDRVYGRTSPSAVDV